MIRNPLQDDFRDEFLDEDELRDDFQDEDEFRDEFQSEADVQQSTLTSTIMHLYAYINVPLMALLTVPTQSAVFTGTVLHKHWQSVLARFWLPALAPAPE